MEVYAKYSFRKALETKGYDAAQARDLLQMYNGYVLVEFVQRGNGACLPAPRPGVIQYVKSTGGKWGKSKQIRHGVRLEGDELILAMKAAMADEEADQEI